MTKLLIIILTILFFLILYLSYLLYMRYKHDTISKDFINTSDEITDTTPENINKIINEKGNILITLKHNVISYKLALELFDKSLPITCNNFRHIAFKGLRKKTYKNTKIYKIFPKSYIEGGDILENNGSGEISLYGKQFNDEAFIFNHDSPGLLSMVSSGVDTNNSKFIITTKCCPELDGKQVVFGRVISGMYHLFNLENINIDENNIPINDLLITDITLVN